MIMNGFMTEIQSTIVLIIFPNHTGELMKNNIKRRGAFIGKTELMMRVIQCNILLHTMKCVFI